VEEICVKLGAMEDAVLAAANLAAVESISSIASRLSHDDEVLSLRLEDGRSVLEVVDRWRRGLPATVATVLQRLSVLPAPFTASLAQTVASDSDVSRADVLGLLQDLVGHGVLMAAESNGVRRLTWRHPLRLGFLRHVDGSLEREGASLREAEWCREWAVEITRTLPGRATACRALSSEADIDLLNVEDLLEWLAPRSPVKAAGLLVTLMPFWRAGRRPDVARRLLSQALASAGIDVRAEVGHRADLACGELALLTGDLVSAASHFEAATDVAEARGEVAGIAASLEWRSIVEQRRGDLVQAERLAADGLDLHAALDHATKGALLVRLAQVASVRGDPDTAHFGYLQALRSFRAAEDARGIATALERIGQLRRISGQHVEAQARLREALELRRAEGEPKAIAATLLELARSVMEVEELAVARRLASEAAELYMASGDRRGIARAWSTTGRLEFLAGDHSSARTAYADALRAYQGTGDRRGTGIALVGLANALLLMGAEGPDLRRAAAIAEEALDELEAVGDKRGASWAAYTVAEIYLDLGRLAEAKAAISQSRRLSPQDTMRGLQEATLLAEGRLAIAGGAPEQAESVIQRSILEGRGASSQVQLIRSFTLLGSIATATGNDERAAVLFGSADAMRRRRNDPVRRRSISELLERDLQVLRARNQDEAVDAWLELGAALSIEATVRYACRSDERPGSSGDGGAAVTEAMRVRLFGGFDVVTEAAVVAVPPGAEASLLGRVAVLGARHVSELVDDLWPETPEDVGRRRLKNVLSKLRSRVGPVVTRRGDVCSLAPGVAVDIVEFEVAAVAALASARAGESGAESACRSALGLYGGELLPDLRYHDWTLAVRLRLASLRNELLDSLGEQAWQTGNHTAAIDWFEHAIDADPMDIDRYVRLASLLSERGWRSRARALVARALAVADDLGWRPSAALQRLASELDVSS
jgi:DNA-binding SARP family transcriptional activator